MSKDDNERITFAEFIMRRMIVPTVLFVLWMIVVFIILYRSHQ